MATHKKIAEGTCEVVRYPFLIAYDEGRLIVPRLHFVSYIPSEFPPVVMVNVRNSFGGNERPHSTEL